MSGEWETTIEHDGMWPFRWTWRVVNTRREDGHYHINRRSGDACTKERARQKAVKARLSIEREDVRVVEVDE